MRAKKRNGGRQKENSGVVECVRSVFRDHKIVSSYMTTNHPRQVTPDIYINKPYDFIDSFVDDAAPIIDAAILAEKTMAHVPHKYSINGILRRADCYPLKNGNIIHIAIAAPQ